MRASRARTGGPTLTPAPPSALSKRTMLAALSTAPREKSLSLNMARFRSFLRVAGGALIFEVDQLAFPSIRG